MSCLRVIDQSIRANDAKVALRHQRSDQLSACKLLHKTFRGVPRCPGDLLERGFVDTCKNPFDSRRVSDQDDRAAGNCGLLIDRDRPRAALRQID